MQQSKKFLKDFETRYRTKNKEKKVLAELPIIKLSPYIWTDGDMWMSFTVGFISGATIVALAAVWLS